MPAPKPNSRPRSRHVAISVDAASRIATAILTRTLNRVGNWHGVVEENHDPITRELVERPLELADQRPQRAVIIAQEIQHLFGLCGLGEGGVAAQIAEHNDDLAAVAFEYLLVAPRDDQFGELRREEALQPPNPAQFLDLF